MLLLVSTASNNNFEHAWWNLRLFCLEIMHLLYCEKIILVKLIFCVSLVHGLIFLVFISTPEIYISVLCMTVKAKKKKKERKIGIIGQVPMGACSPSPKNQGWALTRRRCLNSPTPTMPVQEPTPDPKINWQALLNWPVLYLHLCFFILGKRGQCGSRENQSEVSLTGLHSVCRLQYTNFVLGDHL